MEPVHAHIYDPSRPSIFGKAKANERAQSFQIDCEMTERCDAFKSGCCVRRRFFSGGCKYGSASSRLGHTRRAKKFYDFIGSERERLSHYPKAEITKERIYKIGDWWFLPYSHMSEGVWGSRFPIASEWVPASETTPELLEKIVTARPYAEFGGELVNYQKAVVPKFISDIQRLYPELWEMLSDKAKARVKAVDYVGRTAILSTCNHGAFDGWDWDGQTLSGGKINSLMTPVEAELIQITPKPGATIKITDNSQVGDATQFTD